MSCRHAKSKPRKPARKQVSAWLDMHSTGVWGIECDDTDLTFDGHYMCLFPRKPEETDAEGSPPRFRVSGVHARQKAGGTLRAKRKTNRMPYSELTLIPAVIAEAVLSETYKGIEISVKLRSTRDVEEVEAARKKLTEAERMDFIVDCDTRCRDAYARGARWFVLCTESKSNWGLDRLYQYTRHWLAAFTRKLKRGR